MQQENFSGDNSGRFASGQVQNPQYVLSSDEQNIQGMVGAMQHSPISVTSQPPPYPGTTPLPSMTRTFSQQMQQSQFSPRVAYQNPQQQYQSQQTYVASGQGVGGMSSLSPGAMSVQQGMSVSPGASGLPRKSLAGMMSPIRAQPMNMPPPSPPVVMPNRMQGPISPLSVYMSQAQSPQRRTPHVQSMQPRAYPPPHSPIYPHQPMSYSYGPQAQVPQTSPVPSPRYVDPSQHSQMSSLLPSQGHLHSPQSVGTPGIPIQRSPYKAARQLNMAASPNKIQAYPPAGGTQQWQYSSTSTSQEMWDKVPASPVIPSLPVLSAETLDLLSTLTVSTTTSSMQSSTVSNVSEAHMQKSPLLQQHLLMPAKPIRPSGEGNLLAVSTQATAALTPTTPQISKAVVQQQIACTEVPPSRSDLKRSDRQTTVSSSIEKSLIYKSNKQTSSATSACVSTTNTLTTSIVTSLCKIEDPKQRDNMTTQASTDRLALVSAVENTVVETPVPVQNPAPMDVTMTVPEEPEGAEAAAPPSIPQEILEKRAQLCEVYRTKLQEKLSLYKECLTELFFLKHGGNFMDYVQFKKRPSNKLLEHLKTMMPDSGQGDKKSRKISHESTTSNGEAMSPASDTSNKSGRRTPLDDVRKPARLRSVSHEANSEKPQSSVLKSRSQSQEKSFMSQPTLTKSVMSPSNQVNHVSLKGQSSPLRLKRLAKQTLPASLDESIGSQEEILERAKQEAVIQRKVVELRKQGLWTQRRLPKVQEPPRNKTHWDYLLEEMRWLAADFAQERKWKRAAARKLVRAVVGHHKEQHDMARRAKREEQNRLRRIASTMAREIRIFWGNIGKVVEYKQRSLLDEKRQKALDLHLSYIVDQTEKYSDWLTQGLNKPQGSVGSSPARSLTSSKTGSDDDFLPQGESSDDEETIAVADQEFQKADNTEDELSLLKQESQLPFDELLDSLPQELIENIGKPLEEPKKESEEMDTKVEEPTTTEKSEPSAVTEREDGSDSDEEAGSSKPTSISLRRSARKRKIESSESTSKDDSDPAKKVKIEEDDGDKEFTASQEDSAGDDDEATMEEEEDKESADHKKEIDDLQAEGEMPIEDLMKMYGDAFNQDPDQEDKPDEEDDDIEEESKDLDEKEESSSEDDEEEDAGEEEEIGMDYLLKADFTKDDNAPMIVPAETPTEDGKDGEKKEGEGSPSKEITDVAAEAASLQPTGFTLATTQVVTPIPVLLKHTLREYQHIGLDWLVTMYDKRLNGILADEMGLGKTIQTIALLAHLACDKGVWGPHLIVVPTSVMLNWEMEFKKWCPGFKILTYYGSQKERKAKRTGWTKSNAFHVCITSYKLVLQDNVSFRRKKWKYLVLDEAQNIKNFKSQRWQTLLNFNSQRRLLLTGTPLQNNLMELWSLMHFLMPHVFQSHKEFKEWFSNPLTGMIEGSQDYNEKLVRRLHKVLRPFLLRRIKKDVEKQMPNKYEHVIRCHLSKRQRFLYDDFMAQASTKDTLESGHFMSVINILMQLRKVCNHPNLFEPRPIVSPFLSDRIVFNAPSLVTKALEKDPFETLNLQDYHLHLPSLTNIHQSHAERVKQIKVQRKLIEEMDEGGNKPPERSAFPKYINIREHLGNLIKDRERLKLRNVATLNISQQSLQLLHHGQQTNTLPVLTIPITSGAGGLQISNSAGATIIPSRVITIPQSKADDTTSGRTNASQSFTLQYQTLQGTRVAIPNKIRQLPGGVVQIMAPGAAVKAQASATQSVSLPVSSQETVHQNGTIAKDEKQEPMEVDKKASKRKTQKLDVKHPTSYLERLEQELLKEHKERCLRMASVNETRCEARPDWMARDTIDFLTDIFKPVEKKCTQNGVISSNALAGIIKSNKVLCKDMKPVTDRFVFVIPKVEAKSIGFHVSHPSPSVKAKNDQLVDTVEMELKKEVAPLHSVNLAMRITFPEARLIQYDCGKLQILNVLLRRFWAEKHKCLIFTQMTKVLDILEAFLSYHGYRYLRLDGSTRVEQRMLLMERFNQDPKIFCFILSTRSGGIGVNLTGADTVIFYDSDWNPTMDAQAQDRCHRIGQTRDVHIYRLISERTVEENILKKANQKRLLGDLAIEGGSFTTAFFKEQAIKDLFNEPSGLEDLPSVVEKEEKPTEEKQAIVPLSKPITARQKAIAAAKEVESKPMNVDSEAKPLESKASSGNTWEDALQQTEDKEDVDAAKQLKEEQDADMEEFTENAEGDETMEGSRVHEEMKSIYEELTPIEKYALRYLEETTEEINREELELAEEEVHKSKQDWEIAHLVALKEEEERRLEEEEDEIFYTREDAENQIYIDDVTGETMSVWFPPTPPQDENDIYIDPISYLLYLRGSMPEDQLPVIHTKRERKRTKTESDNTGGVPSQKRKIARAEFRAPRSLFNRPQSQLKKKDQKPLKYRTQINKKLLSVFPDQIRNLATSKLTSPGEKSNVIALSDQANAQNIAPTATGSTDTNVLDAGGSTRNLEWLIHEDWKLLQAVQEVLDMPLSLSVLMPAHTPNWDLVADAVNSISSVYRSPKMCKQRFESVIAPREEGKPSTEISLKKKTKATKTPIKTKITKLQKTISLHSVDNNIQYSALYTNRFDAIKETCSKRTMPMKSSSSGQFQRNPKHTSILLENGITYDQPLPPVKVASQRADRIAREKQAMEVAKQQQQLVQSHSIQGQQITTGQATKSGLSNLGQLTAIPLSGSASNIIVNHSALSAITKKINQHAASKTAGGTALQQTLLRTASTGDQTQTLQQPQIQIQQQSQVGTMVTVGLLHRLSNQASVTTCVASSGAGNNTITLSSLTRPSITVPTGAVIQQGGQQIHKQLPKQHRLQQQMQLQMKQQKKSVKAQLQIHPEAMKKLRQQRQHQQQQLEANVVTVAKVPSKQRKTTSITQQDLEQLLKNPAVRRQIQKPQTAQVQIAPIHSHAQVQAQQVQEAAAQQAAQHVITSKPTPITVPVSNFVSVAALSLGGMNMSISSTNAGTSGQAKSLMMAGQQVPVSIQQIQRQFLKHRMGPQQQGQLQAQQVPGQVLASKVGGKQTVYAMVTGPPLVTQGKRRVNVAAASGQVVASQGQPGAQQPVQLTVTKLLQSQTIPGQAVTQIKQNLTQQSADAMAQHVRHQHQVTGQQLQVASATLVPSSNMAQQQRLITPQRQIRQIQQLATNQQGTTQMILTPASSQQFLQRQNQNVVASISVTAAVGASTAQPQMTLTAPSQHQGNLSQQLQSLLNPQIVRTQGVPAQTTMRATGQHLVFSQVAPQQTLSINAQNPVMQISSPNTPTTMTLAPSLVQLQTSSSVVGAQTQPIMTQTQEGMQQTPSTSAQYVARTIP